KTDDILQEVKALYGLGCRHFRLGKQSDFYSIEDPVRLLREIRESCPDIKVLHIDNVNPVFVVAPGGIDKTRAVVKYCTEGNIAAFGVESFDPVVVKENRLNTQPETAMKAIQIINEHGSERGPNGMPRYLPGINIIFGLGAESKKTYEYNMAAFKNILDNGWMIRRINIRQAAILPNTYLAEKFKSKFLHKNKRFYWKWREDIRQNVDVPMLARVVPVGTVLNNVYTEMYDGKTTFARHIGTYPLIVGVEERLPLKQEISIKVTRHMLRSITGIKV
ncbi:MAG: radical SAM protein, partial [Nanoarchaeota archaeon]|nr:radical SAM protein [Nanoarchaeota archaeon]